MQKEIFAYLFPGMMVMWVFFIGQTAVADLYVERDKKTLMRLAGTPVTILLIVLSKFAYCFALCLLVEFVLVLVTTFLFGVDWGNPFWVFVVVCSTNFTMTGIIYPCCTESPKAKAPSTAWWFYSFFQRAS